MSRGVLGCVLVCLSLLGCREDPSSARLREERLIRAEQGAAAFSRNVDEVAAQAATLTADWSDLRLRYAEVAAAQARATEVYSLAARDYSASSEEFQRAAAVSEEATSRWKLFRELVLVAAAIDAANLDAARAATGAGPRINCDEGMSTHAFRTLLSSQGISLAGKDVDHIVPRSLGGADHPANYRLISASENRSLGNTWNETKCASVGAPRCAGAVSASRKCGSFGGAAF